MEFREFERLSTRANFFLASASASSGLNDPSARARAQEVKRGSLRPRPARADDDDDDDEPAESRAEAAKDDDETARDVYAASAHNEK